MGRDGRIADHTTLCKAHPYATFEFEQDDVTAL
jgi:hypothetical protein